MDPRVQTMADVLVRYSLEVQPGDWVVIQTTPLGEPLADACAAATLRAGGNPTVLLASEMTQETILRTGSEQQLLFSSPIEALIFARADCSLRISAPANTRALTGVPASRLALQRKARSASGRAMVERAAQGTLRWSGTLFPTEAGAQDAGMSLREYEEFVFGACLLNEPDPIAAWQEMYRRQQRIIDWLADKHTVRITGPGTDLTLSITDRHWVNSDGHRNFPSGEIFTAPVDGSVNGEIRFSCPAYQSGREVTDVRLVFRDGVVIEASAAGGEDFLQEMLNLDAGARRLGEFAFGTNDGIQRFTKNTLFDEKIGGTLHMALGNAYPETGSNTSALHWDMVYDLREGAEVTIDGQVFSRNGRFQIGEI